MISFLSLSGKMYYQAWLVFLCFRMLWFKVQRYCIDPDKGPKQFAKCVGYINYLIIIIEVKEHRKTHLAMQDDHYITIKVKSVEDLKMRLGRVKQSLPDHTKISITFDHGDYGKRVRRLHAHLKQDRDALVMSCCEKSVIMPNAQLRPEVVIDDKLFTTHDVYIETLPRGVVFIGVSKKIDVLDLGYTSQLHGQRDTRFFKTRDSA